MSAEFVNDWLSQAKFGMNYQGAAGAFGLYYAVEKGDVRDWSSSVNARPACSFKSETVGCRTARPNAQH